MPQFYLRGFADGDRIATVRLPGDQRFTQSVGDATVVNNFYAVENHEDGPDVIEKALSGVEGATAAVLKTVVDGKWPLDAEDRTTLGYFIALQATRVPVQRRTMDHMAAQMLRLHVGAGGKSGLRRQMEEQGGEVTDELVETLWEQATRPEGPPIQRPKVAHIQQMLELSGKLLKYIVGRPWSLVQFDQRSLVTSDSPVGLIPDPEDEPWQGVGYMTAWGITFPLTRKLGLLMSNPASLIEMQVPVEEVHHGHADMTQFGTTALERFFNEYTVLNTSEWLFHHPGDEKYLPAGLPEPNLITTRVAGEPIKFSGEPWFRPR